MVISYWILQKMFNARVLKGYLIKCKNICVLMIYCALKLYPWWSPPFTDPLAVKLFDNRLYMSRKGPVVGGGILDFVEDLS